LKKTLNELNEETPSNLNSACMHACASNTMILWGDVERLGIDVSKMKPAREFSGLGGLIGAKPIASTISLRSEKGELIEENV
jgi:hypothetical protein